MRRHTLADMHALAQARGGRCLSEAYRGVNEKHQWECALGHMWEAILESIKRGS